MTASRDTSHDLISFRSRGINNDKKIYQQCKDDKRFHYKGKNFNFQKILFWMSRRVCYLQEHFMLKKLGRIFKKTSFQPISLKWQ